MKSAVGILCGGKSSRMGKDKAELSWNGTTLLEHLVRTMRETGRSVYLSVASADSLAQPYRAAAVEDVLRDCGPMGGIYSVLKAAQEEAVFFCAVDMPYVSEQAIEYLERFLDSECDGAFFVEENRSHALCGIYKKSLLPILEKRLAAGDFRMRMLSDACRIRRVPFDPDILPENTLLNINTPEDYHRAQEKIIPDEMITGA